MNKKHEEHNHDSHKSCMPPRNNDTVVCASCSESMERSSSTSTSSSNNSSRNSVREVVTQTPKNIRNSSSSFEKSDNSNRLTSSQRRRSESCTDLNGNSRINTINGNNNNSNNSNPSNNTNNRTRAPSMASLSKNVSAVRPFSVSVDAGSSCTTAVAASVHRRSTEKIHDSRECVKDSPVLYLTPLQRKEREGREMKKEISRLYNELSHKDERIFQLQLQLEEQAKDYQDELDRKNAEIQDMMEERERTAEATRQEKIAMEEELSKMDQLFTDMKVKQKVQEDQFQERYLAMYKRGQQAALFEREQELEMIATTKQPKVTVRELTRKLSIAESELAKWQSLRLEETYKSADKPLTDADVTLSFLKDSFYHFICDKEDCLKHFRAIAEIFRYSDAQMATIRKTVSGSKDFGRLFKKDIG